MAAATEPSPRQGIQSVENAMRVLEALEHGGGPLTLSEVAARAGEAPNKVHRYLVSLCRVGLASQSRISGRYDLGPAMRRLGAEALRRTNEFDVAAEHTEQFRDATGHSINTVVWTDGGPMVVRWDYGSHALPLTVRVGARLPLISSSAGQVFLTHLPERMTAEALELARTESREPLRDDELAAMVASVRESGVAVQTGGVIPGVSSISTLVRTASDTLPFVISAVLPGERLNAEVQRSATETLLTTAQSISAQLGAPPAQ